jgi:hypothetical protein
MNFLKQYAFIFPFSKISWLAIQRDVLRLWPRRRSVRGRSDDEAAGTAQRNRIALDLNSIPKRMTTFTI